MHIFFSSCQLGINKDVKICFLKELIVCVAYLRQKSRVNFRSTEVDAGKLKRKYLKQPWSTLAVKVLR
jgi:hypothetical protein